MQRKLYRGSILATAAAISSMSLAFALLGGGASSGSPAPTSIVASAVGRFPTDGGLTGWVSFADQVSVFRVVSEREEAPQSELVAAGEGFVGRAVTVEILETIWMQQGTEPAVGSFEIRTVGWVLKGETRVPVAVPGQIKLEVGGEYVAPLVRLDGSWGLMALRGTLPLEAGRATVSMGSTDSSLLPLHGLSVAELRVAIRRTAPDPLAVQFRALPADQRVIAISEAREQARAGAP